MEKVINSENIIVEKGLSEDRFNEIIELVKICDAFDVVGTNNTSISLPKEETIEYIMYKEEELIGFIAIFPSSKSSEAKIIGKVHPKKRRKGIFTELLEKTKDVCKERNINTLILINDQLSKSGEEFIYSIGGRLKYSTYKMNFNKEKYKVIKHKDNNFNFRSACDEDRNDIVKIGIEAFGTTEEDEREYNNYNMTNPNRKVYIGKLNEDIVGTVTVVMKDDEAYVCDLAVLKNNRRKGLGRRILSNTINNLIKNDINKMSLAVEVKNKNALSLYEDSGFEVDGGNDFYELNI